ncbi:MAG: ATP-grasp domain-containing protein [Candidatus Pacebacteria bacterium]|nr:ATP-grasp domain-containing protein [Candidatus Paceibacterota bacterium]
MRTVVGVLRGGPSSEYEVSLKSGAAILNALDKEKYDARDLFVDKTGAWHSYGAPVTPERALRGVDVVYNIIHGEYGEDGDLHQVLDAVNIPYTGSTSSVSKLVFNKQQTKDAVSKLGVKVPMGRIINYPRGGAQDFEELARRIFRKLPLPMMIKPVIGGSSVGMTVAEDFYTLLAGLERAFAVSPQILIEEYIRGREATVGVIEHFRDERAYALMPVEIIPPKEHKFFSYDAKYSGGTTERVPGHFTEGEKLELERIAKAVHEALEVSHYSRSDFIISRRGIYFLEINNAAAVGMTEESLMPKAIRAVGSKLSDFTDHIINLAQNRR